MHVHLTRGDHVCSYACVEYPGLTLTWFVDGDEREFDSRETAAKAWNDAQRTALHA